MNPWKQVLYCGELGCFAPFFCLFAPLSQALWSRLCFFISWRYPEEVEGLLSLGGHFLFCVLATVHLVFSEGSVWHFTEG